MSITAKLEEIQQKLKAPKDKYNSFGKYSYRSCESILEAAKPVLAELHCTITLEDEMVQLGDRFYLKATAKITDSETGESCETTAYAREPAAKKGMDDSQITGTASSYARKYALNGLLAIDDTKDADTDEYAASGARDTLQQASKAGVPVQEEFRCKKCGALIQGGRSNKGATYTAKQLYDQLHGLCLNCARNQKQGG